MKKDSPEDRLLRLIKGKYRKKETPKEPAAAPTVDRSVSTEITKKIFLENKILKPSFLKPATKVLATLLVIAGIYVLNSFLFNP